MSVFAGVDPDKDGAIAVLSHGLTPVIHPMPVDEEGELDRFGILQICKALKFQGALLAMEQVHAFPPSMGGGLANFSRGEMRMAWLMAAEAEGLVIKEVPSSVWKKHHDVLVPIVKEGKKATKAEKDKAYKARKQKALAKARELFPLDFKGPKGGDRVSHAEACLIAKYAQEMYDTQPGWGRT